MLYGEINLVYIKYRKGFQHPFALFKISRQVLSYNPGRKRIFDLKRIIVIKNIETETSLMTQKKVDKRSPLPAYAQMANILRSGISGGEYMPGEQLPSEAALAKSHSVSSMTARQAVSVLEEEGLVRRIQGKGTYVRKIGFSASSFGLDPLKNVFDDKQNLSVRVVNAAVKKTPGYEKEVLGLLPEKPVILVERIIFYKDEPFTLHVSFTKFDPTSPSVESMLDTVVLTELIFQEGYSNFRSGILNLLPDKVEEKDAEMLRLTPGESVFKLEHLFYDFDNLPAAYGWFIVSPEKMPLISKIGIWDE